MDDALAPHTKHLITHKIYNVLILVVMDDALAHLTTSRFLRLSLGLNPCCNG